VLARTEANSPGHVAVLKHTLQNRHSCIEGNVRFAGSGNPHSQVQPSKGSLQKRDKLNAALTVIDLVKKAALCSW
jgi:hypothetical protein